MTHRQTLQFTFDPAAFLHAKSQPPSSPRAQTKPESSSPITLTYIADTQPFHPVPLTTESQFFLALIGARLQSLEQDRTRVKDVLTFVQATWLLADAVAEEIRILSLGHITTTTIFSETVLAVKAILLLPALERKTKVEVRFVVDVGTDSSPSDGGNGSGNVNDLEGVKVRVESSAKVVYGEKFNEEKMGIFLKGRTAGVITSGIGNDEVRGSWGVAVGELEGRLGVGRAKS